MTLDEFITQHGITVESVRVGVEPGLVPHTESLRGRPIGMRPTPTKDDDDWEHYAWSVTLNRGSVTLTVPYRMGTAHVTKTAKRSYHHEWAESLPRYEPTPPTAASVLDSLAVDSSTWEEARDFEEFASNLGFDPDSRKAERMYNECGEQAKRLRHFLGREAYDTLLWETERL